MKLGSDVLLKIVVVVQEGIIFGKDISESLREFDLVESDDGTLVFSPEYKSGHGSSDGV